MSSFLLKKIETGVFFNMQYIVGSNKNHPTILVIPNLKRIFPCSKKKGKATNAVTKIADENTTKNSNLKALLVKISSLKVTGLNFAAKYIPDIKTGMVIGNTKDTEIILASCSDKPTTPTTKTQNTKFQKLSLINLARIKPIFFIVYIYNLCFPVYNIILPKIVSLAKQIKFLALFAFFTFNINEAPASHNAHYTEYYLKSLITQAEVSHGIPSGLLAAVASVESGMEPFAVNINGKAIFATNSAEANSVIKEALDLGINNIDIGIFQINYRWHKENFSNFREMLLPEENIAYAARLLSKLKKHYGTWNKAVKYYHSSNIYQQQKYTKKVVTMWLRYI